MIPINYPLQMNSIIKIYFVSLTLPQVSTASMLYWKIIPKMEIIGNLFKEFNSLKKVAQFDVIFLTIMKIKSIR